MNREELRIQSSNKQNCNYSTGNYSHFSKICRTCLAEGENKSIFDIFYEEKSACDLLKTYTSVEVDVDDNLPQNICCNCLRDLFQTHLFIKKCQESNNTLNYIISTDLSQDTFEFKQEPVELTDEKDDIHMITDRQKQLSKNRKCKKKPQLVIEGPPYECKSCNITFDSFDLLKAHRKELKHLEIRRHACSVCSKTFTSSKLRQHMRVHTKEKPYKCETCLQGFSMSGNLKRHMMTHTGERPHVCEVCGKGFIQSTTLQKHRQTHTKYEQVDGGINAPNFICNCCGRGFKRLARYNVHINKHLSENNDMKKLLHTGDIREHKCDICSRMYKTKHLLKAHQLTHGEKSFLCSECGKGFVTKAALQSHLKVHTGEKPHTCNVCGKSFAHVGSFEAHMLIHTGQRPYNCSICKKAFTQLSHLKYHSRTHSGERPYVCSYCGKSFALKGNLTVHVRTHTGETPYLCPTCGKGFYDSSSLKKHRKAHVVETKVTPIIATGHVNTGIEIANGINGFNLNSIILK
ncbi:hypothetical protein FQR65_LT06738 [Abscondita terminalis]|nr:hypothetical protein FQR65_LT06738 [Abscondita terminalis]